MNNYYRWTIKPINNATAADLAAGIKAWKDEMAARDCTVNVKKIEVAKGDRVYLTMKQSKGELAVMQAYLRGAIHPDVGHLSMWRWFEKQGVGGVFTRVIRVPFI